MKAKSYCNVPGMATTYGSYAVMKKGKGRFWKKGQGKCNTDFIWDTVCGMGLFIRKDDKL